MRMAADHQGSHVPGDFAKRAKPGHEHTALCYHRLVVRESDDASRSRDACAAAQLLNDVPSSLNERFGGGGNLKKAVTQAKTTVAQVLVPESIANGSVVGLNASLARVLGVPKSFVDYGIDKRGDRTQAIMNANMIAGLDTERRLRSDHYDRWVIYNYFHHLGDGPDFCSLVEPNKNMRKQWKGKKFNLGGEELTLQCQPLSRRGTKATLVQHYRQSETAAEYVNYLYVTVEA